jgi:3-oxoacyl-[acyl-carrier protein] reductase
VNAIDLQGRVAVITGGSGGIGLATARRMVKYGAHIVILDKNKEALAKAVAELPTVESHEIDLLDENATKETIDGIAAKAGKIDILVNCVGHEGVRANIDEFPLDAWRRTLDVNLTAPFLTSRYVVPHMRRADYGRIVHLASTAGKDGNPGTVAYSCAKAAVIALTKSMGKELAQTGIRVNCVTPAALEGELFNRMPPERQKLALGRIPMGRLGKLDEIAALICWLASEDCSFSTGANFDASGGRSTY